jgi:hypothetical protein
LILLLEGNRKSRLEALIVMDRERNSQCGFEDDRKYVAGRDDHFLFGLVSIKKITKSVFNF